MDAWEQARTLHTRMISLPNTRCDAADYAWTIVAAVAGVAAFLGGF